MLSDLVLTRYCSKMLSLLLVVMISLICSPPSMAYAQTEATALTSVTISETTREETRGDVFEWRCKIEDGHLYKRLYNVVKGCWAGEWILVF